MNKVRYVLMPVLAAAILASCEKGATGDIQPVPLPADRRPVTAEFAALDLPDMSAMPRARCAVDSINKRRAHRQTVAVRSGAKVIFSGWVADSVLRVPDRFTLVLIGRDKNYGATLSTGVKRPDVARRFKSKAFSDSGFRALVGLDAVPPGMYVVSIVRGADKGLAHCATQAKLAVIR